MIIKIDKHSHDFVILDKTCFNDTTLSWRATGLHSYLMGLPHDWEINAKDLINRKTDGRTGVQSAITELENHFYIKKHRSRGEKGRMTGWDYTIYEIPQKPQQTTESSLTVIGEVAPTKDTKSTKDNILKKNITSKSFNAVHPKSRSLPKEDDVAPDPNRGWNWRVMAMWSRKCDGVLEGWKLKAIKPLVIKHGADVVMIALKKYFEDTGVKYVSLARFAATFGEWHHARAKWLDNPERKQSPSRQG